jgi:hypothetical protein
MKKLRAFNDIGLSKKKTKKMWDRWGAIVARRKFEKNVMWS